MLRKIRLATNAIKQGFALHIFFHDNCLAVILNAMQNARDQWVILAFEDPIRKLRQSDAFQHDQAPRLLGRQPHFSLIAGFEQPNPLKSLFEICTYLGIQEITLLSSMWYIIL